MKKTIIILVAFIALQACNSTNDKAKEKIKEHKTKIVISSSTELSFNFSIRGENTGSVVYGTTNLPDSTKVGINLIKENNTFAQDFDVFVINGDFKKYFPISYFDIESVEIILFDNELWQNKFIREQLQFVNSDLWIKDEFGRSITSNKIIKESKEVKETKLIKPEEIINAPQNYTPKGKVDGKIINADNNETEIIRELNNEEGMNELFKGVLYRFSLCNKLFKDRKSVV